MLSSKLVDALNEQLKSEFYSSHLYLAAATYAYSHDLDGFGHFFVVQSKEERQHAMKIFDFLNELDEKVVLKSIEAPFADYQSLTELFEKSLVHEEEVTKNIYNLMDIALEEHEHSTTSFLQWFVDEQVEELSLFKNLLKKVKLAENSVALTYQLDAQLAARE